MARGENMKLLELMHTAQADIQKSLADNSVALAALKQRVDDTHARLFGNGQPGVIQVLFNESETRAGEYKKLNERVSAVVNRVTWYSGMAAGAGMVLGAVGKAVISWLGRGH